jgi:hypothetical protein
MYKLRKQEEEKEKNEKDEMPVTNLYHFTDY